MTRRPRTLPLLGLAFALMLLLGANDDTRFDRLGHRLMCTCGCNQVLLECNHVGCTTSDSMRAELTTMMKAGDSDDLIQQKFVAKYGAVVLSAPTHTGFNRVAWIMPYAALLGGIALVVLVVRRWSRRRVLATVSSSIDVSPEELDQFRRRARQETEL
jgi:cytochrome c-type biogenesis protein CcmH